MHTHINIISASSDQLLAKVNEFLAYTRKDNESWVVINYLIQPNAAQTHSCMLAKEGSWLSLGK